MTEDQVLEPEQAVKVLKDAAARKIELAVAIADEDTWGSFNACIMDCQGDRLVLLLRQAPWIRRHLAGQSACIAFTKGAYRYFGHISFPPQPPEQGDLTDAVLARPPEKLMRRDRRASRHVQVSADLLARATLWLEGSDSPKWSGPVLNVSRGGLQIRTAPSALRFLERGDRVQLAVCVGGQEAGALLNAHFRAGCPDGQMALVGLEFIDGPGNLPAALRELLGTTKEQPK